MFATIRVKKFTLIAEEKYSPAEVSRKRRQTDDVKSTIEATFETVYNARVRGIKGKFCMTYDHDRSAEKKKYLNTLYRTPPSGS